MLYAKFQTNPTRNDEHGEKKAFFKKAKNSIFNSSFRPDKIIFKVCYNHVRVPLIVCTRLQTNPTRNDEHGEKKAFFKIAKNSIFNSSFRPDKIIFLKFVIIMFEYH